MGGDFSPQGKPQKDVVGPWCPTYMDLALKAGPRLQAALGPRDPNYYCVRPLPSPQIPDEAHRPTPIGVRG